MKTLHKEGRMSGLEINNKGKTMKKFFVILLAVCLIATFISCSNEAKVDERVNVSFGVDQTRSLSSSASYADFSTLDWYYKATTESQFDYGEKENWTKLDNGLDTILELSQGIWDFDLCAVTPTENPNNNGTTKVYEGSRDGVLVQKGDKAQTITIDVVPGGSGKGTIVISSNIVVNKKTAEGGYEATTFKANNWEVKASNSSSDTKWSGVFSATEPVDNMKIEEVTAGDYTVTVWYKDVLNTETNTYVIRATEPIDITVYANSTITVKGSIDEETQAVVIKPVSSYQAVAETSVAKTSTEAVITVPVTPAMSSNSTEKTTVRIPSSVYSNETTGNAALSLDVKVFPATESSASNSFTISSNTNTAAAAIDLSLTVDNSEKTEFGDAKIEIETYIAKNLADVIVSYNGSALNPEDYSYDSTSGLLTFKTNHFSTFVVETSSAAMIGDTAYDTLSKAYDATVGNDEIVLLKDINLTSVFLIEKSITINGNGHNIYNTANRVIRITQPNLDVKLYDLGIISRCTATSDVRGISFDNTSSGSSLLLDGCTVSASFYAINLNYGSTVNMVINDSSISGWAAINAYGTGNTITVNNSELIGINDKGYNADGWNNFATICLEGDTTGQTNLGSSDYQVTINDSTIVAKQTTGNLQRAIGFNSNSKNSTVSLNNTNIVLGDEVKCSFAYDSGIGNKIIINGELIYESPEANCWYSNGPFNNQKTGGMVTNLLLPFDGKWLGNGEGIILEKSIELSGDITCQMTSGTFYFYLGDYKLTGGSIIIESGVTVISDKEGLTVFKASEAGQEIACVAENGTYKYSVSNSENSSEETLS